MEDIRRPLTRGPSPEKTKETRRRIIEAALAEFLEKGFDQARMSDIASRSEQGKGTLYRYFPTKESLFLSVLQDNVTHIIAEARDIPRRDGEPLRDYCKRAIVPVMTTTESSGRGQLARLVLTECRNFPQLADVYQREIYTPLRQHFRDLIAESLQSGELQLEMDAEALSYLLIAPLWLAIVNNGFLARRAPIEAGHLLSLQIDLVFAAAQSV